MLTAMRTSMRPERTDEQEAAMHALIIEDEFMIATVIEYVLGNCGFDSFDIVPSSEEAVAAAAIRCPDLITVDVHLQAGSGIDAVAKICPHPSIPVIFITGSAALIRDRIGEHIVLNKPFSEQTLQYVVAASLADRRALRCA